MKKLSLVKMKISDFRKASNTLIKLANAISICFDKTDFEELAITYTGQYSIKLDFFYVTDEIKINFYINEFSSDTESLIKKINISLIKEVEKNIYTLEKIEKQANEAWIESKTHQRSNKTLSTLSALTMLKDIINKLTS